MKPLQTLAVIVVSVAIVLAGLELMRPDPRPPAPDTVYAAVTAKSDTVIRTATRVVTQFKTRVDTLPGDTVYVPKVEIVEVIRACEDCARQLALHRQVADSALRAKDDSIAQLTRRIMQLEKRRLWYAIGGAIAGAFAAGGSR